MQKQKSEPQFLQFLGGKHELFPKVQTDFRDFLSEAYLGQAANLASNNNSNMQIIIRIQRKHGKKVSVCR